MRTLLEIRNPSSFCPVAQPHLSRFRGHILVVASAIVHVFTPSLVENFILKPNSVTVHMLVAQHFTYQADVVITRNYQLQTCIDAFQHVQGLLILM
jgi:hypothetical protein